MRVEVQSGAQISSAVLNQIKVCLRLTAYDQGNGMDVRPDSSRWDGFVILAASKKRTSSQNTC